MKHKIIVTQLMWFLSEMKLLKDFKNLDFFQKFWFFFKIFICSQNFRKKQNFKFNYNCQFLKDSIHSKCWNPIQCSKDTFVTKNCDCAHVRALLIFENHGKSKNHIFLAIFIKIVRIFWRAARAKFLCHRVRMLI